MQRQLAGFAELSFANNEQTVSRVEVDAVESDRLPNPHPSNRQQADQDPVGGDPMLLSQLRSGGNQGCNLFRGVEVWSGAAAPTRQEI
jgi:hypothetical protein